MLPNCKNFLTGAALLAATPMLMGFSLLGPGGGEGVAAKLWQLPAANAGWNIGYNLAGDIGAPVNFGEFYRWNTPVITYAFDSSFVTYFGSEGMKAIDAAMRVLNEVPHVRRMSADLDEFPLNSVHIHDEAAQLGLIDLKSLALQLMTEEIGLTDPIRWNYAIRRRINITPSNNGIYDITRFNFDPVTITPSSYVNGTLWTYQIFESIPAQVSDARELPALNVNEAINYPVAALSQLPIISGYYFTSLTRDDVGGIRYLLNPRNVAAETLLPDVTASAGAFSPFLGTNTLTNAIGGGTGTNGSAGLRGGVGKLTFRKVLAYQNPFKQVRFNYRDQFITTNGVNLRQNVMRTLTAPDITFAADDVFPVIAVRTDTSGWINNENLNGISPRGGPGVIAPPIVITFANAPRLLRNVTPFFVTEPFITDSNARNSFLFGPVLASFDGTTNEPVIYPIPLGLSIRGIRALAEGNQP